MDEPIKLLILSSRLTVIYYWVNSVLYFFFETSNIYFRLFPCFSASESNQMCCGWFLRRSQAFRWVLIHALLISWIILMNKIIYNITYKLIPLVIILYIVLLGVIFWRLFHLILQIFDINIFSLMLEAGTLLSTPGMSVVTPEIPIPDWRRITWWN